MTDISSLPFDPTTATQYDDGVYDVPDVSGGPPSLPPSIAVQMNYSDNFFPTSLSLPVGTTDKVLRVRSTANAPQPPFQIALDPGLVTQEVCLVQNVAPNALTNVIRNYDGVGAFIHGVNAVVWHTTTSFDYTVMNHHCADSSIDWHSQYLDAADHANPTLHQHLVSLAYGTPSNSNPGDNGATGVSSYPSRSDHRHGRENITQILANASNPGLGVFLNLVTTQTFFWLQGSGSSQQSQHPYTSYTATGTTIPSADFAPLEPGPDPTIRGHVWNYEPIINQSVTFLHR